MKQKVKIAAIGSFFVLGAAAVALLYFLVRQGSGSVSWRRYEGASVAFDDDGIPTIQAPSWEALVEAQGFVAASDRLWQMDLLRRFVAGRLSEWYGPNERTLAHDRRRKAGNWDAVAAQTEAGLGAEEKVFCEAYSRGVNRFIEGNPYRWGIEYLILRVKPEPWSCRDTVLVYLSLAEDLSSKAEWETYDALWRQSLGPEWERFLFSQAHPWNEPLFGTKDTVVFPPPSKFLPPKPLTADEKAGAEAEAPYAPGSNAWAWRGKTGHYLASDPHLSTTVPTLWYLNRLKVGTGEWVVGASVPGLFGVVLGMNPHFAWGFTNSMEDADDYLKEEITADGSQYADRVPGVGKKYFPVETREVPLRVKGGADEKVKVRLTSRGPLSKPKWLPEGEYSRQWLVFQKGVVRLPLLDVARAKNWEEANRALDRMGSPAVNVVFLDRAGNMGYRLGGRGLKRSASGFVPQDASKAWTVEPVEKRPRLFKPASSGATDFLVSANQRTWTGDFGHYFSGDNRARRIREFLSGSDSWKLADMEKLQRDTVSLQHLELLRWISRHLPEKRPSDERRLASWSVWDGSTEGDQAVFADALYGFRLLEALLLNRAREHFLPEGGRDAPYRWNLSGAWQIATLQKERGLAAFGLTETEVAVYLMDKIASRPAEPSFAERNRWRSQHPFVGNVPVLGSLFRLEETPQLGFDDLVRMEKPRYGSTVRLVWDLSRPAASTWIMPVGQSGHVGSSHYKDLQGPWFSGKTLKVFPDPAAFGLNDKP